MTGRVEDVQMTIPVVRPVRSPRQTRRRRRTESTSRGRPDPTATPAEPDAAVAEALRLWRLAEARQRAIAPFVILHDRTLNAIAASLPRSMPELETVHGIGPAKIAAYGNAILSVIGSTLGSRS